MKTPKRPIFRTRRQKEIYDFCIAYLAESGVYPSYSTVCRHFGLKSKATVAKHMGAIARQGITPPIRPKLPERSDTTSGSARG